MLQQHANSSFTLRWFLQAGLGALLVVLLGIHLVVNHWVAPQGLLTYADVIRYYDRPGIVWMEAAFLIIITLHGLLGIYAIILDLNLRPVFTRTLAQALLFACFMAIGYGLWLIARIHSLSVP